MSPSTLSIISSTFKGRERGIAFAGRVGRDCGCIGCVGSRNSRYSWLIEYGTNIMAESWRLAFLINVPQLPSLSLGASRRFAKHATWSTNIRSIGPAFCSPHWALARLSLERRGTNYMAGGLPRKFCTRSLPQPASGCHHSRRDNFFRTIHVHHWRQSSLHYSCGGRSILKNATANRSLS